MGMPIDEEVKNIKEQLADVSAKYRMMQSDYNARLKADLVAMLKDLKQDIIAEAYGVETDCSDYVVNVADIDMVIQQKINKLEEQTDGTDNN